MSTSRDRRRLPRLLRLIAELQTGRVQNSTQLADRVGCSRRTVFRDIALLQESGYVVIYDDERQGYYLPERLRLPTSDLTVAESVSLLLLCQNLASGIPFQSAATSGSRKIIQALPKGIRDHVSQVTDSVVIRLEAHNPLLAGEENYASLLRALLERKQIRIQYGSLSDQETICTLLSPYRILFSRRSWYVIGRSSLHRQVRTFNIGRILAAEVLESHYKIPVRFNLDRYLGNAWHLIREQKRNRTIVIRFSSKVAGNVAEVTWHKSQKLTWKTDGTLDFQVCVDGLEEISWWILSYGDQAEVISPPELRQLLRERIAKLHRMYRKP